MGRITGLEDIQQVPPKVLQMYLAVIQMLEEGMDVSGIRVSTITDRAGIGKGTAYEYFDSKEEIVVCAIACQIQWLFHWLESVLEEKGSFREQISFLMEEIDKNDGKKECFLRFVHMMTDNSEFSRMVREKLTAEEFMPLRPANVFEKIMGRGAERGELRDDLPVDYMVHCVFAHLLTYMLAIAAADCFPVNLPVIRELACEGIMNELGTK